MMPAPWTPEMDRQLFSLYLDGGLSARQTGERMGVSRCAVIGRSHRFDGYRCPSDVKRREQQARNIKARADRNTAIRKCVDSGISIEVIARTFALSVDWVETIIRRRL